MKKSTGALLAAVTVSGWMVAAWTILRVPPSKASAPALREPSSGPPASANLAAAQPGGAQRLRGVDSNQTRPASTRSVVINGRPIADEEVRSLERLYQVRVLPGRYWYDRQTGAWGLWGGPALGVILPLLTLGGPLAENASNGDTGVFINGRELHRQDVRLLMQILSVQRGRYWMDANGTFGYEGGPAVGNIVFLANAAGRRTRRQGILSTYDKTGAVVIGGQ